MSDDRPPTEDQLHAYADGRLGEDETRAIEARLATDPALRALVASYVRVNTLLHQRYDGVLDEPIPEAMIATKRPTRRVIALVGGLAACLLIGFAGGWFAQPALTPAARIEPVQPPVLAVQAAQAHAVYVVEVRHPVEVEASEEDHLVRWLTNRMGRPVRAPKLDKLGYRLVGGRLLPAADGGVACQFMYENVTGGRITLFLRAGRAGQGETALRYAVETDGVGVFYWLDDRFGYALTGALDRQLLWRLAREVYEQITL